MIDIQHQPDFPTEDLAEQNVHAILDLMDTPWFQHVAALGNRQSHLENAYARLSFGDGAEITDVAQAEHLISRLALNGSATAPLRSQRDSFSLGYTLFESAVSLVAPAVHEMTVPTIITTEPSDSVAQRQSLELVMHRLESARESFINTQPNSAELISRSLARVNTMTSNEHALTGAAIRCEIELIIRSYRRHFRG